MTTFGALMRLAQQTLDTQKWPPWSSDCLSNGLYTNIGTRVNQDYANQDC